MTSKILRYHWIFAFVITLVFSVSVAPEQGNRYGQHDNASEPAGLFLTWQQDPTTTMTIDWHTRPGDAADSQLYYKKSGEENWIAAGASRHPFPFSDRIIHRVELVDLEPGTSYRFRTGGFDRVYQFRTMPETNHRPVRFAAGGDTDVGEEFSKTNRVAMQYDPDFIVWGGDLAYANAREDRVDRWYQWFDHIRQELITDEGRVVPILLAIGNHEMVNHHYPYSDGTARRESTEAEIEMEIMFRRGKVTDSTPEWREENAPYFYKLFAFPGQPGYGVLDFGNYLSLISLDSSHSNLIGGQQRDWLEEVLKARKGTPHIIPFYHTPAYPSYRLRSEYLPISRSQIWPEQVHQFWVPLFEKHGVRVALENHDHAYKRTYPIRRDVIDPDGVVYIGDGAWGRGTREPRSPDEIWYLKRAAEANHAIIVTLHGPHQHFLAVSNDGEIIDEYPDTP